MKKYVPLIFLFLNLSFVFSQNKNKLDIKQESNAIYLLIDKNDELVLIEENRYVLLFSNKEGLNLKKKKDSIKQGLKPFYDLNKEGNIIVKNQTSLPWLEFELATIFDTIDYQELKKYNVKNRKEFLKNHAGFSKKYAIKKQKNNSKYNIYQIYINNKE
ncbi:hypothetical protein [Aquimarina aquimarini]|uniref:hypothetical protein n=1 Tax=Aquimarina aquimarini TaxID=1191734 RepID=UPI000D560121|nr:hypothetical protein [Aquimarina aquimarini]